MGGCDSRALSSAPLYSNHLAPQMCCPDSGLSSDGTFLFFYFFGMCEI